LTQEGLSEVFEEAIRICLNASKGGASAAAAQAPAEAKPAAADAKGKKGKKEKPQEGRQEGRLHSPMNTVALYSFKHFTVV
jgi:ribosomal protein L12E/L44/L45/RPP1/RPP2